VRTVTFVGARKFFRELRGDLIQVALRGFGGDAFPEETQREQ